MMYYMTMTYIEIVKLYGTTQVWATRSRISSGCGFLLAAVGPTGSRRSSRHYNQ